MRVIRVIRSIPFSSLRLNESSGLSHSRVQLSLWEFFPWPVQSSRVPGAPTRNKEAHFYLSGKSKGRIVLCAWKKREGLGGQGFLGCCPAQRLRATAWHYPGLPGPRLGTKPGCAPWPRCVQSCGDGRTLCRATAATGPGQLWQRKPTAFLGLL